MSTADPEALAGFYHQNSLRWQRMRERLVERIDERLLDAGLTVHQQTSRVKTLESFVAKATRVGEVGSPRYARPTTQIQDFVGLRYVVVLAEDIPAISAVVRDCVEVVDTIEHGAVTDVGVPGYASLHLIARIAADDPLVRAEPVLKGEPCIEVQIRSILQDSFASFSHDLTYKAEREPSALTRRRMIVLASVLDLADREFARVRAEHLDEISIYESDERSNGDVARAAGSEIAFGGWTDEALDALVRDLVGEAESDPRAWLAELRNVLTDLDLSSPEDLSVIAGSLTGGSELSRRARASRPWLRGTQIVDLLLQRAYGPRYVELRGRSLSTDDRAAFAATLEDEWPETEAKESA